MTEPLEGATDLKKSCLLRAAVEELLIALKAKEGDGVVMWAEALARMLDAEIDSYGDKGRETYATFREGHVGMHWHPQFFDRSHTN